MGNVGKVGDSGVKCRGFYVNGYKHGFYLGEYDSRVWRVGG